MIRLRPATLDDAARLLAWRNDPQTRMMSFSPDEVRPGDHLTWLTARLADSASRLYVAEDVVEQAPVGVGRLDRASDTTIELALTVAPERRRQGVARAIIAQLVERAGGGELGECDTLMAQVRPENVGSLKAFASAGFQVERTDRSAHRVMMTRPARGTDPVGS